MKLLYFSSSWYDGIENVSLSHIQLITFNYLKYFSSSWYDGTENVNLSHIQLITFKVERESFNALCIYQFKQTVLVVYHIILSEIASVQISAQHANHIAWLILQPTHDRDFDSSHGGPVLNITPL